MKRFLGKIFLAAAICTLVAGSARAETKIGLIDLRKVFDNYYKTKQADANLKDEAADLEKQRKGMVEEYKKGQDEWKQLLDKSNDQAISADEREKNKDAASKKLAELKDMEQTISQFERSSRARLSEEQRRRRDAILEEIRDVVNAKSKTAGYTLVIDIAASSINDTPVVMYNNGENDLTEAVLTQLNAAAPVASPTGATSKSEEKK